MNKKIIVFVLGLLISAFFIYLSLRNINFPALFSALFSSSIFLLILAFFLNLVDICFRSFKWYYILNKKISFIEAIKSLSLGYSANNLLPAKLGEFVKAYYLRKQTGIRGSLGAITLERVLEGLTLVIIFGVLLLFFVNNQWLSTIFITGLIIFLILFVILLGLVFKKTLVLKIVSKLKISFLTESVNKFIAGFDTIKSMSYLVKITMLSFCVWFFQAITFFVLSRTISLDLSFLVVLLVVCVSNLATVIPSGPGGIGILEYAVIVLLSFFGISPTLALGYGLLIRFIVVSNSLVIIFSVGGKQLFKYVRGVSY